jgi:hypothetical protein
LLASGTNKQQNSNYFVVNMLWFARFSLDQLCQSE